MIQRISSSLVKQDKSNIAVPVSFMLKETAAEGKNNGWRDGERKKGRERREGEREEGRERKGERVGERQKGRESKREIQKKETKDIKRRDCEK